MEHIRPGDEPGQQWHDGDVFLAADGVEWKLCRIPQSATSALWAWQRFGRNGYAAFPYPARPLLRVKLVTEGQEEAFTRSWLAVLDLRARVKAFEEISNAVRDQIEQEMLRGMAT